MKILLDAMGGDNAPDATIKGAVRAINQIEAEIILIGNTEIINGKVKELYVKKGFVKFIKDLAINLLHEVFQ